MKISRMCLFWCWFIFVPSVYRMNCVGIDWYSVIDVGNTFGIHVFKNKQNLLSAFAMQMFSLNTNWRQRLLMSVMTMFISFSAKCKSFRLVENVRRCSELVRCTSFFGSKNKRFNRFDRCQVIILEFKSIFAVQFDNIKWLKTI